MEEDILKYLKAMVALQAQLLERMEPTPRSTKTEVVLSRAGLTAKEIAKLIGKGDAAVHKAIQRANAKTPVAETVEAA